MPIPVPKKNESQSDFIGRCVPIVIEDQDLDADSEKDRNQAVAICGTTWRRARAKRGVAVIKAADETSITLAGYGVVWGGKDLDGDHFTPETDFWFDRITETPMVLWDHGRDDAVKSVVVGQVGHKAPDDIGLWVEAQIQRAEDYAEAITELVETGKLGWSSGAVSHLVEREPDGFLASWPIAEFSLTPTPCEPRTLGVQALRSLAEADPAVKAVLPEGDVVPTVTHPVSTEAHHAVVTYTDIGGDWVWIDGAEASGATVAKGPDEARIGKAKAESLAIELAMEE